MEHNICVPNNIDSIMTTGISYFNNYKNCLQLELIFTDNITYVPHI